MGSVEVQFGKYGKQGLTWSDVWENDPDYCVYLVTQPDFASKRYSIALFIKQQMEAAGLSYADVVGTSATGSAEAKSAPVGSDTISAHLKGKKGFGAFTAASKLQMPQ